MTIYRFTQQLQITVTAAGIFAASMALADADMPAVVLPSDDAADAQVETNSGGDAKASDPSSYMIDLIRGELTDKYAVQEEEQADDARLESLLSGAYIEDYASSGNPVQFSNTVFDVANKQKEEADLKVELAEPAPTQQAASQRVNPAETLMTPAAIRAMSSMSPDQIEAIALVVELMDPSKAAANPQTSLSAIPSLSADDLASANPEELLASLASQAPYPSAQPAEPAVVDVGDGRDLSLGNWETILSPDGRVELSNATLPGSRFDVEIGVVVGQFGRVTNISTEPGSLYVEFETGDRIEGKSVALDQGVPSLDGAADDETALAAADISAGEILISEAAPRPAPAADIALEIKDGIVMKSPRPKSRPIVAVALSTEAVVVEPGPASIRPRPRPSTLVVTAPPPDPVIPVDPPTADLMLGASDPDPGIAKPASVLAPQDSAFPKPHPRRQI